MTKEEIEKAGFQIEVVPRIDMKPRELFEVRLSNEKGHVTLICNQDALTNRISILYENLVYRFHIEIAEIAAFGRGDMKCTSFYD